MGGVVLSDVEASMMEQGKAAVAAMTKTTTQPSQHVRAMPGDPTVDERERFEAMDVIFKLVLTLFVTGVSFGGAVALIVVAFLNADERVVLVYLALTCVAFGVTGYNIIQHAC
ncbi:hypothetical protein DAI22_07g047650 [Oryza sativa Japonica Group]|nr:hypothetical protein DAI22_07g047650 [Oryza sativa Japonica Group]